MVNNLFFVMKEYLKGGFEKRLVRIMLGNRSKLIKITQLEVFNLCD